MYASSPNHWENKCSQSLDNSKRFGTQAAPCGTQSPYQCKAPEHISTFSEWNGLHFDTHQFHDLAHALRVEIENLPTATATVLELEGKRYRKSKNPPTHPMSRTTLHCPCACRMLELWVNRDSSAYAYLHMRLSAHVQATSDSGGFEK